MNIWPNDPVFPVTAEQDVNSVARPGLTKLEWFTGQALKGMLANPEGFPKHIGCTQEAAALVMAHRVINALNEGLPK